MSFTILALQMARSKKACIVFFDEVDAIGGARFDDGVGGDNEVQRTMLEIVNQLDGFDARGNIKVLMATNRSTVSSPSLSKLHNTFIPLDSLVISVIPGLTRWTLLFYVLDVLTVRLSLVCLIWRAEHRSSRFTQEP